MSDKSQITRTRDDGDAARPGATDDLDHLGAGGRAYGFPKFLRRNTVVGPVPLCRICLGEGPKLRALGGGHDLICDACWSAAFVGKGCNGQ